MYRGPRAIFQTSLTVTHPQNCHCHELSVLEYFMDLEMWTEHMNDEFFSPFFCWVFLTDDAEQTRTDRPYNCTRSVRLREVFVLSVDGEIRKSPGPILVDSNVGLQDD